MKKLRLYILACGFILSLLQPGNVFSAKNVHDASLTRGNELTASAVQFPHTELELHGNQWTNAANNSYRVQGGLAFLQYSEFRLTNGSRTRVTAMASANNLSFKDYLSHIYPSHNFW
ncbi:MAG TPA: hypothetical protein VEB42_04325 [Chitinophagaceae bacterium]|nr:hypothetical protein [Chitinophagaceae bacterium]